jgi:hypothetical protein
LREEARSHVVGTADDETPAVFAPRNAGQFVVGVWALTPATAPPTIRQEIRSSGGKLLVFTRFLLNS